MDKPTTLAKLAAPRLGDIYSCARLHAVLEQACTRPITWIVGAPGAGKTTLVAGWLEARKQHALWYQLDAGDNDPATFFHYLSIAASRLAPRKRAALPPLTPELWPMNLMLLRCLTRYSTCIKVCFSAMTRAAARARFSIESTLTAPSSSSCRSTKPARPMTASSSSLTSHALSAKPGIIFRKSVELISEKDWPSKDESVAFTQQYTEKDNWGISTHDVNRKHGKLDVTLHYEVANA